MQPRYAYSSHSMGVSEVIARYSWRCLCNDRFCKTIVEVHVSSLTELDEKSFRVDVE